MRLAHVDIARGICILLVAVGHNPTLSPEGSFFNQILGTFRMPLLFFIAGTFFNKQTSLRELAVDKADALLKPFLVIALLQAPFRIALGSAEPVGYALGVMSGSGNYVLALYALWFLPHLWLLFLFSWGIVRASEHFRLKTPELIMLLGTLLMLGVQCLPMFWQRPIDLFGMSLMMQGLPFSADLLPISSFFFMMGVIARQHFHQARFRWPALLLSASVLTWTVALYQPQVALFDRGYSHVFASTVAALAGSALVIQIATALTRVPRLSSWLAYCGFNSLFILMFHSPIQSATRRMLKTTGEGHTLLAGLLAFAVCIAGSLLLAHLIRQRAWLSALFLPLKQVRKGRHGLQPQSQRSSPEPVLTVGEGFDVGIERRQMARRA